MVQLHLVDSQGVEYTNEDLGFIINKKNVPYMATQNLIQDEIPYRRKKITYRREDKNRNITMTITFLAENFAVFAENVDRLNAILLNEVSLRFEETGHVYRVNRIGDPAQETISRQIKQYELTFENTTPYKYASQKSNEQIGFDEGLSLGMGFRFDMVPSVFDITGNITLNLFNAGNVTALPIIKITGTCTNITIGSLVYGAAIADNLTIDCIDEECYRDNAGLLENKLPHLSGSFIEIPTGDSTLLISGTNLNVHLEIIFEHTYR